MHYGRLKPIAWALSADNRESFSSFFYSSSSWAKPTLHRVIFSRPAGNQNIVCKKKVV
ncbi:hypothetical protein HMPREF9418_2094 [Neisseria macacae ATCC 33926]|uniref:Uncharacterized protein n=1 Tax=Neisseria macacae ATCC 33926 TaxID=997348 RepID=A0AA36XJV7_9NEIS|nr:hypothetical protein HMPREF9418_2094 [Neisseria macacae ATCC 33926]